MILGRPLPCGDIRATVIVSRTGYGEREGFDGKKVNW